MSFRRSDAIAILALVGIASSVASLAPGRAAATGAEGRPVPVSAASLTQQGQQLVWQVVLAAPFSPGALGRDGRTLCLLIDQATTGGISGRLCVAGPGPHSSTPRVLFTPNGGNEGVIASAVTRSSARDLTARFLPAEIGLGYQALRWQVISTVRSPPCVIAGPSPVGCSAVFPSAPALVRLHEPRLVGCAPSGPNWVFSGPKNVREVALTFDDGPWYDTPQLLTLLEREHVVATFFQIGDQIGEYAKDGLDRRMLADGDMIGDHTWNYGDDVAAGGRGAVLQIDEAAAAIRRASGGFEPCLFRAPGGNVTPALLRTGRSLGFTTIQWDVDPRDWTTPGVSEIYHNVVRNAHDGAIVIQHDGGGNRAETLAALPLEIRTLRSEGYRFVTVTQLLGYQLVYR